ncbi:hypothetical protein DFH09DRAFT_1096991 [Mycena vulgaris]|nr:hypothetical protein DFH09DRAFT_1096991 [Mycena vulgaris]
MPLPAYVLPCIPSHPLLSASIGRLLFSSYCVEVSVNLILQQHHIPGSEFLERNYQSTGLALVVLMIGFLGHGQLLLSLVDWHAVPSEVHAVRVILNSLLPWRILEDQAAFWAFAYLLVKPLAHATDIATDIRSNGGLISEMLNCFGVDRGTEYFEGATQLDSMIQADTMIPNQLND